MVRPAPPRACRRLRLNNRSCTLSSTAATKQSSSAPLSPEKDLSALPGADGSPACAGRGESAGAGSGRGGRHGFSAAASAGVPSSPDLNWGNRAGSGPGAAGRRGRWGVRSCGGEGGRERLLGCCWQAGKGREKNSAYNSWTGRQNIYTDKKRGEGASDTTRARRTRAQLTETQGGKRQSQQWRSAAEPFSSPCAGLRFGSFLAVRGLTIPAATAGAR
ncbi:hypothetical protein SEVIR_2G291401v4 [Setaria viridis]